MRIEVYWSFNWSKHLSNFLKHVRLQLYLLRTHLPNRFLFHNTLPSFRHNLAAIITEHIYNLLRLCYNLELKGEVDNILSGCICLQALCFSIQNYCYLKAPSIISEFSSLFDLLEDHWSMDFRHAIMDWYAKVVSL